MSPRRGLCIAHPHTRARVEISISWVRLGTFVTEFINVVTDCPDGEAGVACQTGLVDRTVPCGARLRSHTPATAHARRRWVHQGLNPLRAACKQATLSEALRPLSNQVARVSCAAQVNDELLWIIEAQSGGCWWRRRSKSSPALPNATVRMRRPPHLWAVSMLMAVDRSFSQVFEAARPSYRAVSTCRRPLVGLAQVR